MTKIEREKFYAIAGVLPPKTLRESDEMGDEEGEDLSAADQGAEMGGEEGGGMDDEMGGDDAGVTLSFTPEEKGALVSLAHKIIEAFGEDEMGGEEGGGEEPAMPMSKPMGEGKSAWGSSKAKSAFKGAKKSFKMTKVGSTKAGKGMKK